MTVKIHSMIIHELEKEAGSNHVRVFLSDKLIPSDPKAEQLIRQLNDSLTKKEDILHGFFETQEPVPFPKSFSELTKMYYQKSYFIDFSRETMATLKIGLQGVIGAKGGYFVYAHYDYEDRPYVGIFLVRDTEGIVFHRDEARHTFNLDSVTYLNTDKLALACRVDIEKYRQQEGRYLEVIKYAKTQAEISDYFLTWIGIVQPESTRAFTENFVQALQELPLPSDKETGAPMQEDDFFREVYQYARKQPQKVMNLQDFDHHFYADEPVMQNLLREKDIPLDMEFRYDPGTIRKLYKFQTAAEGISLGCSRGDLTSSKVEVKGDEVIIHSRSLARKLRNILEAL